MTCDFFMLSNNLLLLNQSLSFINCSLYSDSSSLGLEFDNNELSHLRRSKDQILRHLAYHLCISKRGELLALTPEVPLFSLPLLYYSVHRQLQLFEIGSGGSYGVY